MLLEKMLVPLVSVLVVNYPVSNYLLMHTIHITIRYINDHVYKSWKAEGLFTSFAPCTTFYLKEIF
jgi:hypothetical protein